MNNTSLLSNVSMKPTHPLLMVRRRAAEFAEIEPDRLRCQRSTPLSWVRCLGSALTVSLLGFGLRFEAQALEVSRVVEFSDSTRYSAPAVGVDGKVYVGIQDYGIGMYDPRTNTRRQEYLGTVVSGPTIGHDGRVYVGINAGGRRNFFALNANTLGAEWEIALEGGITTSAAVGWDGALYVGTATGTFYCLNPRDGRIVWQRTVGGVRCSPVIGLDGHLYVAAGGSQGKHLAALSLASGQEQWRVATGEVTLTPAIGSDGTIYCGDDLGVLLAIHPNGAVRWSADLGRSVTSGITIGEDGTVFAANADGRLFAYTTTGTRRWSQTTEQVVRDAAVVGNDSRLHVVEGRWIVTRRVSDGAVVASLDRRGTHDTSGLAVKMGDWAQVSDAALTHDGILWFGNGNYLWSYSVGGGISERSPYPMGQGNLRRSGKRSPRSACVFATPGNDHRTLQAAVLGVPGKTYDIQQTSDFRAWTHLSRTTTHNGIVPMEVIFAEPLAHRFYRAVEQP